MVDEDERARVKALMHQFSLNWDADRQAEEKEPPLAKIERLTDFYRKNPCVASPLLLKSIGIDPGRRPEAQPPERGAGRKA